MGEAKPNIQVMSTPRDRMRESRIKQRNRRFMFAVQLSLSGVLLYYILKKLKK